MSSYSDGCNRREKMAQNEYELCPTCKGDGYCSDCDDYGYRQTNNSAPVTLLGLMVRGLQRITNK